jgi:hypothetical protein
LIVGAWLGVSGSLSVVLTAAHHHFSGFLLSIKCHQFFAILLVWHA